MKHKLKIHLSKTNWIIYLFVVIVLILTPIIISIESELLKGIVFGFWGGILAGLIAINHLSKRDN